MTSARFASNAPRAAPPSALRRGPRASASAVQNVRARSPSRASRFQIRQVPRTTCLRDSVKVKQQNRPLPRRNGANRPLRQHVAA